MAGALAPATQQNVLQRGRTVLCAGRRRGRLAGERTRPLPHPTGELFLVGAGRASSGQHPPKTLSWHGAKTSAPRRGADPSAAKVRSSFVSQSD